MGEATEIDWIRDGDPVSVRLLDGRKITGALEAFSADEGSVSLRPHEGGDCRRFGFADLKMVQILIDGRMDPSQSPPGAQAGPASLGVHEFHVLFEDNDSLEGRTVGFRQDRNGLYVFPLIDDGRYFCTFVPHGAMARHTLGRLIEEPAAPDVVAEPSDLAEALEAEALESDALDRTVQLAAALASQSVSTAQELEQALHRQDANLRDVPIGELLIAEGLISQQQLDEALARQAEKRDTPLGELLVETKVLPREFLYRTLASKFGVPAIDLRKFHVDPKVVKMVPREIVRRFHVLPVYVFGNRLVVATENALDWTPIEAISFATGMHVEPIIASRVEIERAIDVALNAFDGERERIELDFSAYRDEAEDDLLSETQYSDNMVVSLVNQIIGDAHEMGASDIHIEPNTGRETRVRVRKDGELRTLIDVPAKLRKALVARIKVMAGLNIAERRKPQDGRVNLRRFTKMDLELRVATVPTVGGNEDVVMRVIQRGRPVALGELGLCPDNERRVADAAAKPYGMILVTGPTGSGKSTTLYSLLEHLNTPERKIWTAEDPVELSLSGVRQVHVNDRSTLSFASALRSFLRADPDVIMVGEMRDRETAAVCVEASLTGHLVLSTLHTNSAVETVGRLLDMGMDPFNFSDALIAVIAQRLTRRICTECGQRYEPDDDELQRLAEEYWYEDGIDFEQTQPMALPMQTVQKWRETIGEDGVLSLLRPRGCSACDGKGYAGRIALHEVLEVDAALERLIQARAPTGELRAAAIGAGMRTLRQDGIEKVLHGHTDIQQVRAVCTR